MAIGQVKGRSRHETWRVDEWFPVCRTLRTNWLRQRVVDRRGGRGLVGERWSERADGWAALNGAAWPSMPGLGGRRVYRECFPIKLLRGCLSVFYQKFTWSVGDGGRLVKVKPTAMIISNAPIQKGERMPERSNTQPAQRGPRIAAMLCIAWLPPRVLPCS